MWVGLICFVTFTLLFVALGWEPIHEMLPGSMWRFALSGALGIGLADWCLFRAFSQLGTARTMLIYNFHPIFMSVASYFLFGQTLSATQIIAILFLMACVFVISLERYRENGSWDFKFVMLALIAVSLDASGVILTRQGFDLYPNGTAMAVSAFRFLGAMVFLVLVFRKRALPFLNRRTPAIRRDLKNAAGFSVTGSFLSLALWITALKYGHMATLSALAGFNPVAVTLIESVHTKRWPTLYLWVSLGLFACGFALLMA